MIASVIFCVLVAGAFGQHNHSCDHSNIDALKEAAVIGNVLVDMDSDNDGVVSIPEVTKEFVTDYDKNGDGSVTEEEFINTWYNKYHDSKDFAGYLFHHFDAIDNEKLDLADVTALEKKIDTNHDGKDSSGEFRKFMNDLYTQCLPINGHHIHHGNA